MRIVAYAKTVVAMTVLQVLSALSEPIRLSAIRIIWDGGEHCVCELMERLQATQSRMSRHMGALKAAGLVVDRRDAQWVRYRRNPGLPRDITQIVDAVIVAIDNQGEVAA
jgi:ArsR family transcriptional regulator